MTSGGSNLELRRAIVAVRLLLRACVDNAVVLRHTDALGRARDRRHLGSYFGGPKVDDSGKLVRMSLLGSLTARNLTMS